MGNFTQYFCVNFLCFLVYVIVSLAFYHGNSQRDWHGNVHDNVNVFGLGGIDLLRCCGRASTDLLLPIYLQHVAVSM